MGEHEVIRIFLIMRGGVDLEIHPSVSNRFAEYQKYAISIEIIQCYNLTQNPKCGFRMWEG
jgi:hypothetical protein